MNLILPVFQLPFQLIRQRFLSKSSKKPKFTQEATFFEDLVVRCVKYAFANFPTSIGKVFFSKWISLPFLRWRMLRHGYLRKPVSYREYEHGQVGNSFFPLQL